MGEHIPRNIARREQRLPEVARLYGMGKPQERIAEQCGVDRSVISRDVKLLHQRWLASANADYAQYASEQLHKIDLMEHEYWEAWLASKKDDETSLSEEKSGTGAGKKVWVRKRRQCGTPAFLDGVMNCVRERCKLLGLYAGANLPGWRSQESPGGEDGGNSDTPATVERELARLNADLDEWAMSCRRPSADELPPGFRPAS